MSKFTDAIVELKTKIKAIAGRDDFAAPNSAFLTDPTRYPSYSDNALQAIWNIVSTLEEATDPRKGQTHLLNQQTHLTNWFNYLEAPRGEIPGGTLQIIDQKTYDLGKALHSFLSIVVTNEEAQKLLTPQGAIAKAAARALGFGDGIENLKQINARLVPRLVAYEKEEEEFARYKDKLAAALASFPSISIPDLITIDSEGNISYTIALSELADEASRLTADYESYGPIISQLTDYNMALAANEAALLDLTEGFMTRYPVPFTSEKFKKAQLEALSQTLKKYQDARALHLKVETLLQKAKKEQLAIKQKLSLQSQEGREEILRTKKALEESMRLKATTSQHTYTQEKAAVEAASTITAESLAEVNAKFNARKATLTKVSLGIRDALARLTLEAGYSAIKAPNFTKAIIYFLEDSKEIQDLCAAIIDIKTNIEKTYTAPATTTSFFGLIKTASPPKSKPEDPFSSNRVLMELIHILVEKLTSKNLLVEQELSISLDKPLTAEDPISRRDDSLFALHKQASHMTAILEQRKQLPFKQLQALEDSLRLIHASFDLQLTEADFKLNDFATQEGVLRTILATPTDKLTVEGIETFLTTYEEDITQLSAWLTANNDICRALATRETELNTKQHEYVELFDRVNHTASTITKDELVENGRTFAALKVKIDEKFSALKDLQIALISKKNALILRKLEAIATKLSEFNDGLSTKETTTSSAVEKVLAEIKKQLELITTNEAIIAEFASSQDPVISEAIASINASKVSLTDKKNELETDVKALKIKEEALKKRQALKVKFFGTDDHKIEGTFDKYLNERNKTYKLRDWIESIIFGCFGYKTQKQRRTAYIEQLAADVTAYEKDPTKCEKLKADIARAHGLFAPRARQGKGYEKSFKAHLESLEAEINKIENPSASV